MRKRIRIGPLLLMTYLGGFWQPQVSLAQTTVTSAPTTRTVSAAKPVVLTRATAVATQTEPPHKVSALVGSKSATLTKPIAADKTLRVQLQSATVAPTLAPGSEPTGAASGSSNRTHSISEVADVASLKRKPIETVVMHSDNSRTQVAPNASSVTLRTGDLLVARSDEAPVAVTQSQLEGATSVRLPYEVLFLDERGTERHCEVFAEMAGGGMRLTGDGPTFTTQIYVGLRDQKKWDQVYALPHPLLLLVTANVDRVAPDLISLSRTNEFKPVELSAADPTSEVKVKVRAADRGLELNVPVHRPRATLDVNPRRIQGFGLESAQIHIRTEGLPNPKGRSVRLQTSSGRLLSNGLTLDENGVAHAELRSAGFGSASLEVSVFQLAPDTSAVEFEWPWRFLGFALLGGAVGSLTNFLQTASPKRRRTNWKPLAAGMLTGLMAAAASAVGVNLLALDLPNMGGESLALVVSAIGAWGLVKFKPGAEVS